MKIIFKYNLIQDLLCGLDTLFKRREYLDVRSVVRFSFILPIKTFLTQRQLLFNISKLWKLVEKDTLKGLDINGISFDSHEVTVYVVSLGVEGKYDDKRRNIWARYYMCGGEKEFIETIIHELIHIYFGDGIETYDEIEDKVGSVVDNIGIDSIFRGKKYKKYSIGQGKLAPNQLEKLKN
ncbi:MAG: hypothetical protein ABIC57_00190 [bacterium]